VSEQPNQEAGGRPALSTAEKVRYGLYALAVVIAFFAVLDGVLGWMERAGHLELDRKDDAPPLSSDPWVDSGEGYLIPDPSLHSRMPAHRLKKEKEPGSLRVMMVGASFFAGVPYTGPGTIHFWLEEELKRRFKGRTIEVANGSMSAMDSSVVRRVAEYAVGHEPDVLVVATCNNEGTLQPSQVTKRLHDLGTFRVFRKMLRSEVSGGERPLHTVQDPDTNAVRTAFEENLEAIIEAAAYRGIPVLLCTLPVHYRYEGDAAGLPLKGEDWEGHGTVAEPACVANAKRHLAGGRHAEAERLLEACDEVDAVRTLGILRFSQQRFEEAKRLLTEYLEVVPRNRCRPTFNAVIRQVAAKHERVYLVDLAQLVSDRHPHGMPSFEAFTDYCHLNWRAQGDVAHAIAEALTRDAVQGGSSELAPLELEPIMRKARTQLGLQPLPDI
jgi:hypothetical protein